MKIPGSSFLSNQFYKELTRVFHLIVVTNSRANVRIYRIGQFQTSAILVRIIRAMIAGLFSMNKKNASYCDRGKLILMSAREL